MEISVPSGSVVVPPRSVAAFNIPLGLPPFSYRACSYRWAAEAISRVCRARRRTDTPLIPSGE